MPNPIYPGAIWDPGRFANYGAGRTSMQTVKVHCTAGTDSYGICKNNGLIQWLIPYEGQPWQFAPADALCYDSGPYNTWGPGFEIERPVTGGLIRPGLSEFRDLSDSQVHELHGLIHWLADEWGFRVDLYDGPRYGCGSDFGGFVNHGDIESQRSDGMTREEWDRCIGDDMTEDEVRHIIDSHMFDELPQFGNYSRFTAALEGYMLKPTVFGVNRLTAWVIDSCKSAPAAIKKALGL